MIKSDDGFNKGASLAIIDITLLIFVSAMLSACGGTWIIEDTNSPPSMTTLENITIERMEGRLSPRIKTFHHLDMGVYKESAGHRYNAVYAKDRVVTPPGNIQIGAVHPAEPYTAVYYPEIEFVAVPGHNYYLTWICDPFPVLAVVDAISLNVVGVETLCLSCAYLIGQKISPANQCLGYSAHPPGMEPDEETHWVKWVKEVRTQRFKSLCNAAEQGIATARSRLGMIYLHGLHDIKKDILKAYAWFKLAVEAGDIKALEEAQLRDKRLKLSPEQIIKVQKIIDNWHIGQCAQEMLRQKL